MTPKSYNVNFVCEKAESCWNMVLGNTLHSTQANNWKKGARRVRLQHWLSFLPKLNRVQQGNLFEETRHWNCRWWFQPICEKNIIHEVIFSKWWCKKKIFKPPPSSGSVVQWLVRPHLPLIFFVPNLQFAALSHSNTLTSTNNHHSWYIFQTSIHLISLHPFGVSGRLNFP